MPAADPPPTVALTDTVNAVASDLGVGRPAVLDTVDGLADGDLDARACLRLDVGHETALALRAHVEVS